LKRIKADAEKNSSAKSLLGRLDVSTFGAAPCGNEQLALKDIFENDNAYSAVFSDTQLVGDIVPLVNTWVIAGSSNDANIRETMWNDFKNSFRHPYREPDISWSVNLKFSSSELFFLQPADVGIGSFTMFGVASARTTTSHYVTNYWNKLGPTQTQTQGTVRSLDLCYLLNRADEFNVLARFPWA